MSIEEYEAIRSVAWYLEDKANEAVLYGCENGMTHEEVQFWMAIDKQYHELWKTATNEFYNRLIF